MEFKQLEAYTKLIEERSFSKAADAIELSQPSVSTYISSLEKELEIQLVFRSTRKVLPTKAGKAFYNYAKNILTLRDKAVLSIKNLSESTEGEIKLSASSITSQYILPDILSKFNKLYPKITFIINQKDSAEVVKSVTEQISEFGIVGTKIEDSKCYYKYLTYDKLVVITPNGEKYKRIKTKKEIKELLQSENFIIRKESSGTRTGYEEFLKSFELSVNDLNIVTTFSNAESVIFSVMKGLGISVVSELAIKHYVKENLLISIPFEKAPKRKFYFVFKKDFMLSSISELFIDFVDSYFDEK